MKYTFKTVIFAVGILISWVHTSNATIFNLIGEVDYGNSTLAGLFGVNSGTTGTFTAQLNFDETQLIGDAFYNAPYGANATLVGYNATNISYVFGNQSWSVNNVDVGVHQGVENLDIDATGLVSSGNNIIQNGYTVTETLIIVGDEFGDSFSSLSADNFLLFNFLTDFNFSTLTLMENANSEAFELSLSNISLTAVPLPAGVWLFGSAIVGFVGMRRRKKQAATLAAA